VESFGESRAVLHSRSDIEAAIDFAAVVGNSESRDCREHFASDEIRSGLFDFDLTRCFHANRYRLRSITL
jgi:hypothetical protein